MVPSKYFQPHAQGTRPSYKSAFPVSDSTEDIDDVVYLSSKDGQLGGSTPDTDTIGKRRLAPFTAHVDTPRKIGFSESRMSKPKPGGRGFNPTNTLNNQRPGLPEAIKRKYSESVGHGEAQQNKRQRTDTIMEPAPSFVSRISSSFENVATTAYSQVKNHLVSRPPRKGRRSEASKGERGSIDETLEISPQINLTAGFDQMSTQVKNARQPPGARERLEQRTQRRQQQQVQSQPQVLDDSEDELASGPSVTRHVPPDKLKESPLHLQFPIQSFVNRRYRTAERDLDLNLAWEEDLNHFVLCRRSARVRYDDSDEDISIEVSSLMEFCISSGSKWTQFTDASSEYTFVEFLNSDGPTECYRRLQTRRHVRLVTKMPTFIERAYKNFMQDVLEHQDTRATRMLNQQLNRSSRPSMQPSGTKPTPTQGATRARLDETHTAARATPQGPRMRERMLSSSKDDDDVHSPDIASGTSRAEEASWYDANGHQRKAASRTQRSITPQPRSRREVVEGVNHVSHNQHDIESARSDGIRLLRERLPGLHDYSVIRKQPKNTHREAEDNNTVRRSARASRNTQREPTPPPTRERWTRINKLEPWSNPVVYPPEGARRVTVEFKDLERLDEGEFLNDTLISFGLRRIEESIAKKDSVHFFNSYFYSTLSSNKSKGVNYDSVKRWTKNTDLLSTEFIVVPINLDLHWFVAIICNLPALKPKSGASPMLLDDLQSTEKKLDNMSLGSEDDVEVPDSQEAQQPETKSSKRKRRRVSVRKFDVTGPSIVTLDSLGHIRTSEIANLKDYIAAELADKQNLDVSRSDLQGVTAKNIIEQDNFCDCGLFLIGYMEAFARDPRAFVNKLLNRSIEASDFAGFNPSQKRAELRNDLLALYTEQEEQRKETKRQKVAAKRAKVDAEKKDVNSASDLEAVHPQSDPGN